MLTISIQAGGQSQRMGRDKALIHLAGKPMIEHILERIEGLGDEILITTNNPKDFAYLDIRLESDPIPGSGSLAGLHTALKAARGSHTLVLACDMPFISRPLLEYMIRLIPLADVIVPQREGYFEPLHAIYSQKCLLPIEDALQIGDTRVISFYDHVQVRIVDELELARFDPEGMSFFNINTPEDLILAEDFLHEFPNYGKV
jgi:molybdopterin-guanine dinucleotide biosynthesis protein A